MEFDFLDNKELLTFSEFVTLIREIIYNENIEDGSVICYKMFSSIMSNSIRNNIFEEEFSELNVISKCIQRLKEVGKFNPWQFKDLLLDEFTILPMEILWWLQKNEIVYLSQYCERVTPSDFESNLLSLLEFRKEHKVFVVDTMVQDILIAIIGGCYQRHFEMYLLEYSKTWANYCYAVLNNMIETIIKAVIDENDVPFINFLPFVLNSKHSLPTNIITKFYENILKQLLVCNVDEYDLYNSYTYQQLWSSDKINGNLLLIYEEIFSRLHHVQNIFLIIQEYKYKINWKYTLAAVGVCLKKHPLEYRKIKDAVIGYLDESFKGGRIKEFIKALLFVRQACFENNKTDEYQQWYSQTFGSNSSFKSSHNPTLFKFTMTCLTKLIPLEPIAYLKMHCSLSITAPPLCNFLIHDYKDLCRARLEELKKHPFHSMNGVDISVFQLCEEISQNRRISFLMIYMISKKKNLFYENILPDVLQNKPPYTKVKDLLLQENYVSQEIMSSTPSSKGCAVLSDECDDFIELIK